MGISANLQLLSDPWFHDCCEAWTAWAASTRESGVAMYVSSEDRLSYLQGLRFIVCPTALKGDFLLPLELLVRPRVKILINRMLAA